MSSAWKELDLAIFPLTGTLLLPGTYLPLNVFEKRYRNMVKDALADDGLIGMIQPMIPGLDNWGVPPLDLREPELYPVGCCGRIGEAELQPDGRYLIVLEGVIRFRVVEELQPVRGYRRVRADFREFEIDIRPIEPTIDRQQMLSMLETFSLPRGLEFDADLLRVLTTRQLVDSLSTALPFTAVEKQALLESPTPEDRAALLVTLMGFESGAEPPSQPPMAPTIH